MMSEQEKEKGNKMIAEFMQYQHQKIGMDERYSIEQHAYTVSKMEFRSSWDWLMPVVEKIEDLDGDEFSIIISGWFCEIENSDEVIIASNVSNNSKIEAVWEAVVSFIEWHNAQSIKS